MNCLDTNFLIAYQDGDDATLEYLEASVDEPFAVSAISLFELYRGDVLGHSGQDPEDTRLGLGWIDDVLPFDEPTALHAGALLGDVHENGGSLDPVDAMIAASADRAGATLVTRDEDLLRGPVQRRIAVDSY